MAKMTDFDIGKKFRFLTKDSEYEGIVQRLFYSKKLVCFKNVRSIPDYSDLGKMEVHLDEFYTFKKIENNLSGIFDKNELENKAKVQSVTTARTTCELFDKSGILSDAKISKNSYSFSQSKTENILPESALNSSISGHFNVSDKSNLSQTSEKSNEGKSASKYNVTLKKFDYMAYLEREHSKKMASQNVVKLDKNEFENKTKIQSETTVHTTCGLFDKSGALRCAEISRNGYDSFSQAKTENILPCKIKENTKSAMNSSISGHFNTTGESNPQGTQTSGKNNEVDSAPEYNVKIKKFDIMAFLEKQHSKNMASQNAAKPEKKISFIPAGMDC